MTVTDLLTASRAAHTEYRMNAGRIKKDGSVQDLGNEAVALRAVRKAYALRTAAHILDKEHADAAWEADKVPHADLMHFFEKYLR